MNIERKSTIYKLILKTVNQISSQEKSWLFYKRSCDNVDGFRFINIFEGLEENWRFLVP